MKKKITLSVSGMSCAHCELTIEEALSKIEGVESVEASLRKGAVTLILEENEAVLKEIKNKIRELGYQVKEGEKKAEQSSYSQSLYILIILLGGYVILKHLGILNFTNFFPQIEENMSYGVLFVIGLLTSLHCVAMCGGINLAQSVNSAKKGYSEIKSNLAYNLGRVISYTIIGGIVGGVGSVIHFGGGFKGGVAIFAGVFMVIMGLNMLEIFPWLKRFNLRMPKSIGRKINKEKARSHSLGNHSSENISSGIISSFYIGLLNGLMPCGPLQSMQLYALSSGSFITGALSMFLFSLGTVPLMFILGTLSSKLNKQFAKNMMTVCAMLVIVLGLGMLNNGLSLSGITLPKIQADTGSSDVSEIKGDYQTITSNLEYGTYPAITVKAGIPVKWTIVADKKTLNGCNSELLISEYGIDIKIKEGENLIEFTPDETGVFGYSCWMGMIRSTITVVE